MAAPGGLLMAKILVPETGTPVEQTAIEMEKSDHSNAIDALAAGAMNGMKVSVAIGTMLIAFVSVIAMVNAGLESVGEMFGFAGMTMQKVLGYVFSHWLLLRVFLLMKC